MENFCSDLFFIFVCIVLIFFALVMLYIIDFREFNKIFKPMMFFLFVVLTIIFCMHQNKKNVIVDKNILKFYNNYIEQKISIQTDYIIIVGDSRMAYLSQDENLYFPINMKFIAKPGAGIEWFKEIAIKDLEYLLNHKEKNRFYSVVFNMGVNDLGDYSSRNVIGETYYNLYQDLALKYPDVMFYIMSINPINDYSYRNKSFPKVTNNKIIGTNQKIILLIDENNVKNITYCDAFNNLTFGIYDGIHYDSKTNKKILNYIINDCVLKNEN